MLGFRLFLHTIRMKRETIKRFKRNIRRYDFLVRNQLLEEPKGRVAQAMQSIYDFSSIVLISTKVVNTHHIPERFYPSKASFPLFKWLHTSGFPGF